MATGEGRDDRPNGYIAMGLSMKGEPLTLLTSISYFLGGQINTPDYLASILDGAVQVARIEMKNFNMLPPPAFNVTSFPDRYSFGRLYLFVFLFDASSI